jgi:hypothetical protein
MAEMKPGDVRVFKRGAGKSLALAVGLWAERKPGHIEIHVSGHGKNTTVNNKLGSIRYHRTLFRNLRSVLIDHDVWQFGDEGSETEDR